MMQRFGFEHDGLTLSYLDTGGNRPLILAIRQEETARGRHPPS